MMTEQQKNRLRAAASYVVALGCLIWVFHDVRPSELWHYATAVNPWWVLLSVACNLATYLVQGWRWRMLLRPVGPLPVLRSTGAVFIGQLSSQVLPLRVGEVVRSYLASRWLGAPIADIIPSVVVERLFDGLWMAIGIMVTAFWFPLPHRLAQMGDVFGIGVAVVLAFFVWAVLREEEHLEEAVEHRSAMRYILAFIFRIARGLRSIGLSRYLFFALVLSLAMFLLQVMAFWLIMVGYGLELSVWVGAVVFLIVHIGTAIPNAPGNVGTFQFFCVLGLLLFGVAKTEATGFSVIVFVLLTLPLSALGVLALARSGQTIYSLRTQVQQIGGEPH